MVLPEVEAREKSGAVSPAFVIAAVCWAMKNSGKCDGSRKEELYPVYLRRHTVVRGLAPGNAHCNVVRTAEPTFTAR